MSELIEQFGGYEVAKQAVKNYRNSGDKVSLENLEHDLLEYRRKNGIFEVGDKVVHPKFDDARLYEVREVKGGLVLVYFDRLSYSFRDDLRHATNEEIKQERRL